MLSIEPLRVGDLIEWDIEDILTHHRSIDFTIDGVGTYCQLCYPTGDRHSDDYIVHTVCVETPRSLAESWDALLEYKRDDEEYDDIQFSLMSEGFTVPLTANPTPGGLRFCDGNHRLAAAIQMGYRTVPVLIATRFSVAEDSGEWSLGDTIPRIEGWKHQPLFV